MLALFKSGIKYVPAIVKLSFGSGIGYGVIVKHSTVYIYDAV